jgi:hypothetical protein
MNKVYNKNRILNFLCATKVSDVKIIKIADNQFQLSSDAYLCPNNIIVNCAIKGKPTLSKILDSIPDIELGTECIDKLTDNFFKLEINMFNCEPYCIFITRVNSKITGVREVILKTVLDSLEFQHEKTAEVQFESATKKRSFFVVKFKNGYSLLVKSTVKSLINFKQVMNVLLERSDNYFYAAELYKEEHLATPPLLYSGYSIITPGTYFKHIFKFRGDNTIFFEIHKPVFPTLN